MQLDSTKRKLYFYITVIICFIAILIYNCLTPLISDDLVFNIYGSSSYSLKDLLKVEYNNYMTWNGRVIPQFIMHCFLLLPKWIFNIANSLCFIFFTLLIYWNIRNRKEYDFAIYALVNLLIWQFGVSFSETILWLSGACNYLWAMTIILGFVTYFRYKTEHSDTIKHPGLLTMGLLVFGIMAGWCNENTSGGGLLLVLFYISVYYIKNKNLKPWMITGSLGMCIGLFFMVIAPGNAVRSAERLEQENHTGLLGMIGRFLKINIAIETYLFPLLAGIIILTVYFLLRGRKIQEFIEVYVFVAVSFATSFVLILTTPPMDRAYFGAGIFMTIAFLQMVANIPKEDVYLTALKYSGILVFTIFMYFSYCENGANLMRIYREVDERHEYIQEQLAQGNREIVVPQLRPEFENKYSYMYKTDIIKDPNGHGNKVYRIYYDLKSITGIPREEWTAY